jgi:hypothetical protein
MRIDQTALPSRAANQRGTDTSGTARDGLVTDTADPTMAGTNAGVLQPAETPSAGTAAAPADLVVIDLLSPNAADATSPVPDVSNLDQTGAEFEVQDTIDDAEQLGR